MSFVDNLTLGLTVAFTPVNLLWCFVGVSLGTLIGVLPGIGALSAIALLLPVTFHLDPTSAIVMLAGVFYGSSYGGSTAAILLNLPGTPSTAVTALDGYPMAKQGRAGVALLMTTVGSFVGGSFGILVMMFFSPLIVYAALQFGPAEYFSLMLLGFVGASTIATGAPVKGFAMVVLGVMLGLVGSDVETGTPRFTFGMPHLYDGISLVAIAMGLFGVAEVIVSVRLIRRGHIEHKDITFRSMIPTRMTYAAPGCRCCEDRASAHSSAHYREPAASSHRSWLMPSRRRSRASRPASAKELSRESSRPKRPIMPPIRPPSFRP
jgi:putative tricarboxylic transport membrane protein